MEDKGYVLCEYEELTLTDCIMDPGMGGVLQLRDIVHYFNRTVTPIQATQNSLTSRCLNGICLCSLIVERRTRNQGQTEPTQPTYREIRCAIRSATVLNETVLGSCLALLIGLPTRQAPYCRSRWRDETQDNQSP